MSGSAPPPLQVLREVGPMLYGEYWQTPAAGLLGVTPRAVRRWIAADRQAPEWIVPILREALKARLEVIRKYLAA